MHHRRTHLGVQVALQLRAKHTVGKGRLVPVLPGVRHQVGTRVGGTACRCNVGGSHIKQVCLRG